MKSKFILASALLAIGVVAAHAQSGPSYTTTDLVVSFENPAGTDLEFNLGAATSLPTTGTEDFGSVSSFLTSNGQTVGTTLWSVAAQAGGGFSGQTPTLAVPTSSGTVTALGNAFWISENTSNTPSFVGSASPSSQPVNTAISAVGVDIATNPALAGSGLGALGVAVSAQGDPNSYTKQGSYANVSTDLEVTGNGTAQLWLLTATTNGTNASGGRNGTPATNEGPFNGATDLGTFALSSGGDLTFTAFTAIPEPSTYAAILGALTIGFVAIRRRKAGVI